MYIIKNALKCISRSKGRNILIGIIVLVIAIASCIGLSIRKASETAREETLEGLSVTATIEYDRISAMESLAGGGGGMGTPPEGGFPGGGGFDRNQFSKMMNGASELSLEEYEKYAEAESVRDFYYTVTIALNGSDDFLPVGAEEEEETEEESTDSEKESRPDSMPGGFPGMGGMDMMGQMMMGMDADFSVEGVSSDIALTSFTSGNASITSGAIFEEGTEAFECIISKELSINNDNLEVGDTIILTNPNNEEETYEIKIVGIYTDSSTNEGSFSISGATSTDPANKIYMSAAAVNAIVLNSQENSTTVTDENTGREYETEISKQTSANYVFADTDSYYKFEEEVREMGLDESYTVSSSNLQEFEDSLVPLDTLSTMAGWFLLVILAIGAIILIVLNIFNIRERKYEIGVLTAMGMKKSKVALQFIIEIFTVTVCSVIIGAVIGAVSSVPVTNALLENQIESQNSKFESIEDGFGRDMQGMQGMEMGSSPDNMPSPGGSNNPFGDFFGGGNNYVSEITSATDVTVLFQMLGIAVLLTLVSGAVSMLFVMRYEPLKILVNRD